MTANQQHLNGLRGENAVVPQTDEALLSFAVDVVGSIPHHVRMSVHAALLQKGHSGVPYGNIDLDAHRLSLATRPDLLQQSFIVCCTVHVAGRSK
jgi:hypothetical protein